ncbi:MAG: hypothetical protein ACUVV6_09660, partial [Thermoplasmatota archaeon]
MVTPMRAELWVIVIAIGMLLPAVLPTPSTVRAENVTKTIEVFANGLSEIKADFQYGGTDKSNALAIQTGLIIENASLRISTASMTPEGKDFPTNVSVDFGGDGRPEWAFIGKGYGALGRQTIFNNGNSRVNMTVGMGASMSNDTLAIRLPKRATVTSAKLNISVGERIGTKGKILMIYASGYSDAVSNAVNQIKKFSSDFTAVDTWNAQSSTPTWDDIKDYWSILVWNHAYNGYRFADKTTLGNLLADYVDAGGGVVCLPYLFASGWNGDLLGRFDTEGYYVIGSKANSMSGTSSMTIGSIKIPNHPIMYNVTSITFSGIQWLVSNAVNPPGEVVFTWSLGNYVGAAVKNINGVDRVDIQMMPYSDACSFPTYSQGYSGDGDKLIRNSLLYAGRKTLDGMVDLFNDSAPEFNETSFSGNFSFPDFTAELNSYLASAEATFTDQYGNEMVDVPINVTARAPGMVSFNNLEVLYNYSCDIDRNPHEGDLASSLNELMSTK